MSETVNPNLTPATIPSPARGRGLGLVTAKPFMAKSGRGCKNKNIFSSSRNLTLIEAPDAGSGPSPKTIENRAQPPKEGAPHGD